MNHTATLSPFALIQLQMFQLYERARPHLPMMTAMLVMIVMLALPGTSFAQEAGGGMPWEGALQTMAEAMTGPWVKWLAIIAIACGGILFGIGELNGPFKYALQIAAGFSVAVGAATFAGMVMAAK